MALGFGWLGMKLLTRATIAHPQMKIRRERLLPKGGEVVVRVGQNVTPHQAIARTPLETDFHIIPVSEELDIDPEEINEYLQITKGEPLEAGQIIAEKKRLFGKLQVTSPVDGVFYEMNNGRIIIQSRTDWLELRALVAGNIVNYIADRGAVIETKGCLVQGVWGSGKESFGKLKMAVNTSDAALSAARLKDVQEGQIIVCGRLDREDALEKAAEGSINGIIAGSITNALYQIAPTYPFPIIITDGIGLFGMTPSIFNLLHDFEGKECSVFAKYDENKNQRPEIIIPQQAETPGGSATPLYKPLDVGNTVRILREPYHGLVGEVVKLYNHSQTTSINIKTHGADIKLPDGSIVFIPGNNLDVFI